MSAENYVEMCRRLWRKACEWEGVDPVAEFVGFSDKNPWAKKHSAVFNEEKYREAVRLRKE